jgi:hypothetical protein
METPDSIQNHQTYTGCKLRKPLQDENWTVHYNFYKCTGQSVETGGQVGKLALNPVNEQILQSTVMGQLQLENSNLLFILAAKGWGLGGQ